MNTGDDEVPAQLEHAHASSPRCAIVKEGVFLLQAWKKRDDRLSLLFYCFG